MPNVKRPAMKLIAAAALMSLAPQVAAQTNQPACLTRADIKSASAYAMPLLLKGVQNVCSKHLPASSFMASNSNFTKKYEVFGAANRDAAMSLLARFQGSMDFPGMDAGQSTEIIDALIPILVEQMMSEELKPSSCQPIDEAMALLDPLPAENLAGLVGMVIVEVIKSEEQKSNATRKGKDRNRTAAPTLCKGA